MNNARFIHQLKSKKETLERRLKNVKEDCDMEHVIIRRIELINILLVEFGSVQHRNMHPNSLKNILRGELKRQRILEH